MRSRKEMYFRNLLTLTLALLFPTIMAAQTGAASSSAESSPNRSVKQRLEQILPHIRQTLPATTEAQSSPAGFDPRSRYQAHQTSPLPPVRLPGAPVAAERYVFGRMDLATGDYPTAVAVGAFQTGGPQSIAVANYSYPGTVSILLANPDGIFLARVDGAQFRWHAHKPFYVLRLSILEPRTLAGQPIVGRLYCTQKAMWKLGWFLRDFLYDPELLAHEQVDEKALPGLRGVVKISHTVINGISLINLDGFAPASQWEELSATPVSNASPSNPAEASR